MINVKFFEFNPFQENTYILYDETKECIIIDPGMIDSEEENRLRSFIETEDLKPVLLLNTHCHIDHVLGNYFVASTYKLDLQIHLSDLPVLEAVKTYAPNYGIYNYTHLAPAAYLDHGDVIKWGKSELEVIFVPGHAPGHIAFVHKTQKFCIGGDTLFRESIGRTDLPGGNFDTLIGSIKNVLFQLDEETIVYCGHGPETTIGHEKKHNPFLQP